MTGCAPAVVEKPLAPTLGGVEPEKQMEFWHQLAEQPVTSNDDAFHALLIFIDGQDAAADYAARVAALKEKGLLPASFNQPATQAADRGTLSVALAKTLKLRGGIVYSIFGPSPRYATKELEHAEIYPPSSPNQIFSGSEFLAVMSRAEEYQLSKSTGGKPGDANYVPPELELRQGIQQPVKPVPAPSTQPATEPAGAATKAL
ncbi:hypothetical protein [Humisphaera borealis]|uniref:hypothetical protein n=1 Tax=Humisphaera borealis TaxID=2807512 RepID=UPI0019D07E9C|nr:hypothetical protein [Humisphaera borealis]